MIGVRSPETVNFLYILIWGLSGGERRRDGCDIQKRRHHRGLERIGAALARHYAAPGITLGLIGRDNRD